MAVVMAAMGDDGDSRSILYAEGQLNHTVEAVRQSVLIDGSAGEWEDDSVFFVGSNSQAQATIRVAYDDENLYLLTERLDENLTHHSPEDCDSMDILLCLGKDSADFKLNLNMEGLHGSFRRPAGAEFSPCPLENAQVATRIYGTVNHGADTDVGFVTEIGIPWSALGGIPEDRKIALSAVLYNTDGDDLVIDPMTGDDPKDWYTVILG
jgi:hypothetical protein